MRPDEFIICITFFLLCVVASLLIAIFHTKLPERSGLYLVVINVVLLMIAMVMKFSDSESMGKFSYLFLTGFCSGILSSGIFIRMKRWTLIRIYSMAYLLLIPAFLVSPSKVVGFIGTGSIDQYDPVRKRLADNYYLIEQIPVTEVTSGNGMYKVVREMGMFHKTLKRDIRIDTDDFTVKVTFFQPDSSLEFMVIPARGNKEPINILVALTPDKSIKP